MRHAGGAGLKSASLSQAFAPRRVSRGSAKTAEYKRLVRLVARAFYDGQIPPPGATASRSDKARALRPAAPRCRAPAAPLASCARLLTRLNAPDRPRCRCKCTAWRA